MKSLFWLLVLCILWSRGSCIFHSDSDFESDLESWSRLKRRAGYYTASGRYRGGLYRRTRDEELEFYHCTAHNGQFCLSWTVTESGFENSEYGDCECAEETTHYCASWSCVQREIRYNAHCDDDGCRHEIQAERTTCFCSAASNDDRYCKQWSCIEIGPDNTVENEIYTCLKTHKRGRYCERWKGEIFSDKEVESSVCQCDQRGENYCRHWTCKERGLKTCERGGRGWCNFPLAVGLAGGFGVVGIFGALVFSTIVTDGDRSWRLVFFFFLVAALCLPWTAAVAIWGGVRGIIWVALMWGIICVISAVSLFTQWYRYL